MSDDYVPTTEEVRETFGLDRQDVDLDGRVTVSYSEAVQAFDAWLAAVKAEAWEEGCRSGLSKGLDIAELVHQNGGVLPFRKYRLHQPIPTERRPPMSQSRKHRGMRTQKVVAEWFAKRGWPFAESAGAGRQGTDVTGTPDLAIEVKARTGFNPLAWVRQAVDAADGRLPFVVVRCNGQGEKSVGEWPVLIRLEDFTQLLKDAGYGDPK